MAGRVRMRRARGLAALLVAVAVLPAGALVWLGARLLVQDRALVAQRDLERRQAAAPALARALDQILTDIETTMDRGPVPDGAVRLTVSAGGVGVEPGERAAWLPVAPAMPEASDAPFIEADALESRDAAAARVRYETLARSQNSAIRAGALLRLARQDLGAHRWDAALDAYRRMATITTVSVLGAPADLQARRWLCDTLADAGRRSALDQEAAALERDFLAGRWALDRDTWQFVSGKIATLTRRQLKIDSDRRLVAGIAETLWTERVGNAAGIAASRRVVQSDGAIATVLLRAVGDRLIAVVFPAEAVSAWVQNARAQADRTGAVVSVLLDSGSVISGPTPAATASTVFLRPSDTRLPWTLALAPGDTSGLVAEFSDRRRLVLVGVFAPLLILVGGTFFVWRVMRRELAVSRLQTDFVAAVSHEFRTPLTSLRHVTELLEEQDDVPAQRRHEFYSSLSRNTNRLQRLVESLLDFSRMESGRRPFALRDVDAVALVHQVVADFRRDVEAQGATITIETEPGATGLIRADEASLATALWNLLDNAVKYSSQRPEVEVRVSRRAAVVSIAVRDHGLGIPAKERDEIFGRFVRGAEAASRGIKGTGLGLALVSHIVQAHAGTIAVESEEGRGSTFTMEFPCLAS